MTTAETHAANTILADLEAKLAAAKQRQADAQAQIADVAYDAHCDDVAARKELQRAAAEAVKASGEIIGLEAAVAEARRRANHASALAADDVEREHARIALGLLGDFEKRGEALDHAMSKVLANYDELVRDFNDLQKLGYAPSTMLLVRLNMTKCVQTKLMAVGLQSEFLAPRERMTFRDAVEGWAASVRGRIEARIKRNPPKAAA